MNKFRPEPMQDMKEYDRQLEQVSNRQQRASYVALVCLVAMFLICVGGMAILALRPGF